MFTNLIFHGKKIKNNVVTGIGWLFINSFEKKECLLKLVYKYLIQENVVVYNVEF